MLPFSSSRQAKRVRQDNNITEDVWNGRRGVIRAEHRLPNARDDLVQQWKERIIAKGGSSADKPAPSAAGMPAPDVLPFDDA